jgi:hypothetical protein
MLAVFALESRKHLLLVGHNDSQRQDILMRQAQQVGSWRG